MNSPAPDFLLGRTIRGYELRRVIGVGGFGVVYQAYQPVIERDVAVKVVLPVYADDPDFIRRFESEAQIIARLEHPYIVPLYDFWREPGGAYLIMRWLQGGSLRDRLSRSGFVLPSVVAQWLDQIAAALIAAHSKGVIHQDIKPENILLDEYDNAYLADFGIAKKSFKLDHADETSTRFITVSYASPEQLSHGIVSAQSDIYSLGIVIYELLTGTLPFMSASDTTLIYRKIHEPVALLSNHDLPFELNQVIWRATAKNPEDRYADTLNLAVDFRRALNSTVSSEQSQRAVVVHKLDTTSEAPAVTKLLFQSVPENPYKGLQPFSEADEADFFGQDQLIGSIIRRLSIPEQPVRFLAIVGPSGSGKSSLLMAGVIPRLRHGSVPGSDHWFFERMNPGDQPFKELEAAILRIATQPIDNLSAKLREPAGGLHRVLTLVLPNKDAELVLVIDQFEELFTLSESEKECRLFLTCLLNAIQAEESQLRVILTLRADFYDRPLLYIGIGNLLRTNTEVVLPLSLYDLEQVIIKPAERHGLQLEEGLLFAILEDVREQPSSLPLLQFALTELYERRDGRLLTLETYHASGGVLGALARRADEIYEQFDAQTQVLARQILLRLVVLGEMGVDTSRRVLRTELALSGIDKQRTQQILDAFGKFRLITFDHDPSTRTPTIQVAHEALFQVWDRLRTWININREELQARQNLSSACLEWTKARRDPSFLATGARLAQFEALGANPNFFLNDDEKQYVNAGIALRKRTQHRVRLIIVALAILAVVSFVLALFALDRETLAVRERDRADLEAHISRSRELAVTALTKRDQPDLSLLLSLEALQSADTFEARNSLLTTLQSNPHLVSFLRGHTDGVRSVGFSPDGRLLASGGRDGVLIFWDTATGQPIKRLSSDSAGWINSIVFSPDGKRLASGSEDGTIRLWDVTSGNLVGQPFIVSTGAIRSIAFSPNGELLASGSADGAVRLWNVASGELIGTLSGHTDVVWSVAFSPDGKQLASGSADQTVRIWSVDQQNLLGQPLSGHSNWVLSVAFSPDGRMLASGGADNTILLWDTLHWQPIGQPLTGQQGWIRALVFSPDGKQLASGSADHTVRLWNIAQGSVDAVFQGHSDAVWGLAFHPDGHMIASAGADRQVLLWDTGAHLPLVQQLASTGAPVTSLAFDSPDNILASSEGSRNSAAVIHLWDMNTRTLYKTLRGYTNMITSLGAASKEQLLASSSLDGIIRLWNLHSFSMISTLTLDPANIIYTVAISPDGKTLAAGTEDGDIMVWDVSSGSLIATLNGKQGSIYCLAFNPDGRLLASGGRDATIHLWDVSTHQAAGQPLNGHSDSIMSLAFSSDGKLLASGSRDTTVRLWSVVSGKAYGQPLLAHTDWVTSVAFSPNNEALASGSQDSTVRLWDVTTGQQLGLPFSDHQGWVNSLIFNAEGTALFSGGQDGAIILHDMSMNSWEATACHIINRNLTDEEWQRYFPDRPYHETCIKR